MRILVTILAVLVGLIVLVFACGMLLPANHVASRSIHLDHPQDQAWDWVRAVGSSPAAHAGFAYKAVIAPGAPADLVLFRARSWTELNSRPQTDRIVLRQGKAIDTALPDYRELDDLME